MPLCVVSWIRNVDIEAEIQTWKEIAADKPGHLQYALATYLRYKTLVEAFAAVVSSLDDWTARRAEGRECFAFLRAEFFLDSVEGAQTGTTFGSIGGILLLRSAWTGDIVVDFLVKSPRAETKIAYMLVYAALRLGGKDSARLVLVETAKHSLSFWARVLAGGTDFIKVDRVDEVARRIATAYFEHESITVKES